ncbi:MAG: basic amino acid ABC transporter substrate-binding protein [Clostridia bacterium]|nr:basic amino acid ABC transporter substrate-binding protein [Clostridia bacterium]
MKTIIKITAAVLALIMALGCLAACGAKDGAEPSESKERQTVENNGQQQPLTKSGKLIMATNASFPPYEFIGDSGEFAGIDVEIAGLIAEKLGLELEIQDVDFGSIIGGVQTGKFDMGMAGMTVTDERKQSVNFSTTYATGVQAIIVPAGSTVKSFDDLSAKKDVKIGVQQDTTGDIYITDELGADHVVQYKTGNDAVQALVAGKVDAVVIDNQPAKSYVGANKNLVILDTPYTEEDYAICVAKENTELLEKINAAIAELQAEGKIDEIIGKYITE